MALIRISTYSAQFINKNFQDLFAYRDNKIEGSHVGTIDPAHQQKLIVSAIGDREQDHDQDVGG